MSKVPRLMEEYLVNKAVNITAVNKIKLLGNLLSVQKEQLWNVLVDRKICAREDICHLCGYGYTYA